MKKWFIIGLAWAAGLGLVGTWPTAAVDISGGFQVNAPGFSAGFQINGPSDFYQPLSAYGDWVNYGSYGRCWHPTQVGADWRPYTDGSWEWTDAGWYWQSDEPWGWATCHYGSWTYDSNLGWIWIPGTEWAPAWVVWRDSDDYIGWAPCGPNMSVLGPSFFVFAGIHDFGSDHFTPHNLIINNREIINRTHVIKDFGRKTVNFDGHERTIFSNRGPGVERIQRATGRSFTARPVTEVVRQSQSRRQQDMRGNENRTGERNQSQQQQYNREQRPNEQLNQAPNREQRPNEQLNQTPNREATPPPTGREQNRQFEQPRQQPTERSSQQGAQQHQVTPAPTGREQNRQFEQPQQRPTERQSQPGAQQHEATPSPTGREQNRMYNQPQQVTPAQHATPSERNVSPERTTPAEKATPEQRQAPSEHAMPPTGRENSPPTVHESAPPHEAAPAQRPETRTSPELKGPPQTPPGQERKDSRGGNQ